ncbi:hypothetical protein [Streptomyces sp. NPDC002265]|uniref:hypothetical protein n=1 Tax=Streptomyces sp. NPDC002265 TaxID=3154415 RepID=UPI003325F723
MADPQQPDDPDAGKDFSYLVPTMTVGWNSLPSFNDTETPQPGGGPSASTLADSGPFYFAADTVRATETTLLTQARIGVSHYEALRQSVNTVLQGKFWGPAHPSGVAVNVDPSTGGGGSQLGDTMHRDDEILAGIGDEFARHINPAMQKVLALLSNSLELLGNYIAVVNATGQSYATVDRHSRFPGPPGTIKK